MNTDQNPETKSSLAFFTRKVWIVTGILALSVILIFLLKAAFDVLLMILAASLIAVYFHGLADVIERLTKFKRGWSMAISVALTLVLSVATCWFMGNKLQLQISELQQDFPEMIEKARQTMDNTLLGKKILEGLSGLDSDKMMSTATGLFNTGFGVIANLYIIIFLGIFFTIDPEVYKKGIIKLTPSEGKKQAEILLERIANVLKGWLKGMLIAMLMITIFTLVSLLFLDVPLALTLALLAGLMNFVPNFGPIIAMIPAVLIGFTMSTNMVLIIIGVYLIIQALESSVVTPVVQKKMINLPPALTIMGQVLMGTFSGILGVLLATPLVAIIIVVVDELYIKKQKQVKSQDDLIKLS